MKFRKLETKKITKDSYDGKKNIILLVWFTADSAFKTLETWGIIDDRY